MWPLGVVDRELVYIESLGISCSLSSMPEPSPTAPPSPSPPSSSTSYDYTTTTISATTATTINRHVHLDRYLGRTGHLNMKIGWLEKKSYGGMVRLREDQKIGSQNEELVE